MNQTHLILNVNRVHRRRHCTVVEGIATSMHVELALRILVGLLAHLVRVHPILLLYLHVSILVFLALSRPGVVPLALCVLGIQGPWSMGQQKGIIVLTIGVDVKSLQILALEEAVGATGLPGL